jgi:uncharacterized protein YbjT (DUF2867 family)
VPRALLVGCGCRGRALAAALTAHGHSVRGTTRDSHNLTAIDEAGAEAVVADPDRLGTVLQAVEGVTVVCWLMGSAEGGSAAALHGPRLETMLEKLVDTPVRGLVYEGAGTVEPGLLAGGAQLVHAAAERWRIPVAVVEADPAEHEAWVEAVRGAFEGILAR